MDPEEKTDADWDRTFAEQKRKMAELEAICQEKRRKYLEESAPRARYFLMLAYDLPPEGKYSKPEEARDYFLRIIPKEAKWCGVWAYEDKKKDGSPAKRHIHITLAADVLIEKFPTWKQWKAHFYNYLSSKLSRDGGKKARGQLEGWLWRIGKPAVYALSDCEDVRDIHGTLRYCLKWQPEDCTANFLNIDLFRTNFPEFDIRAERLIAIQQRQDAAERLQKFLEKAARKSTLELLLEEYADVSFQNMREIYDKVLEYHMVKKLNIVDTQIIMYMKTIAIHKGLITKDDFFDMLMKKF